MRSRVLAPSVTAGSLAESGVAATLTLVRLFCNHPSRACGDSPQVIAQVRADRAAEGRSTANIATSTATTSEKRIH